jgi:hypothetical protein
MIVWALVAAATLVRAAEPAPSYSYGMELRARGETAKAKEVFRKLLEKDANSGGAYEGLTLTSLTLGQYEEALDFITRWQESGDSAYKEGFKARAYDRLGRRDEATDAWVRAYWLDPTDAKPIQRADERLRADAPGLFPFGAISKSLSLEELSSGRPQRIVYEGRSGGANARVKLRGGTSALAGAEVTQTAQRNDRGGFTYFDVLEKVFKVGLGQRWGGGRASAVYGQTVLTDNKSVAGVGKQNFSRFKLTGEQDIRRVTVRGSVERSPYYLRGAGGANFFAVLREVAARGELEGPALGMDWLARGAVYHYSDHSTYKAYSLLGTKEIWGGVLQPNYSHSFAEAFGARADARINAKVYDRLGARARFGPEGVWRASASYGWAKFRDANRSNDLDAEARYWLPSVLKEVNALYRFHFLEYAAESVDYRSTDERGHWLGAAWRRHWGSSGPWTEIEYAHGYLNDTVRGDFEGNAWTFLTEWYRGRSLSVIARGRVANTSLTDKSYSASLQGRWTF